MWLVIWVVVCPRHVVRILIVCFSETLYIAPPVHTPLEAVADMRVVWGDVQEADPSTPCAAVGAQWTPLEPKSLTGGVWRGVSAALEDSLYSRLHPTSLQPCMCASCSMDPRMRRSSFLQRADHLQMEMRAARPLGQIAREWVLSMRPTCILRPHMDQNHLAM